MAIPAEDPRTDDEIKADKLRVFMDEMQSIEERLTALRKQLGRNGASDPYICTSAKKAIRRARARVREAGEGVFDWYIGSDMGCEIEQRAVLDKVGLEDVSIEDAKKIYSVAEK